MTATLTNFKSTFAQYKTAFENDSSSLRAAVDKLIADIINNSNDLAQTISIVENNRVKFVMIDDRELIARKQFVSEAKDKLAQYERDVVSVKKKSKKPAATAAAAEPEQTARKSKFAASASKEADRSARGTEHVLIALLGDG